MAGLVTADGHTLAASVLLFRSYPISAHASGLQVRIFQKPKTKGSVRDVDLLDQLRPVLEEHLSSGGSPNDLVVTNANGKTIKHRVFYPQNFVKARDAALPDHPTLTFHDLRHTFVSWLLAAGVDLITVAKQAGRSNPAIAAQVYAHAIKKEGGIKAAVSNGGPHLALVKAS